GNCTQADGTVTCAITSLAAGAAADVTVVVTPTAAGTISITASASAAPYDPTPANNTAVEPTTVLMAPTTAALTSSASPTAFSQPVTLTATVDAVGTAAPTGTVDFTDGSTVLGTRSLDASGVAVFTTSALAVGSHAITAVYGGDPNFLASTSG